VKLSEAAALRAYAGKMNTLSSDALEPMLSDDFVYESQTVFQPLASKQAFLEYMTLKLQSISRANTFVYAEMGNIAAYGSNQPCVILAQNDKSHLVVFVIAKINENKLKRLNLCVVPPSKAAERSGEYPK